MSPDYCEGCNQRFAPIDQQSCWGCKDGDLNSSQKRARTYSREEIEKIKDGLICDEVCANHHGLAYIHQLESTYSQVSKALCGKENATLDELLQAVDQLKSERDHASDSAMVLLNEASRLKKLLVVAEFERDVLRQCICGDTVYKLITTKDGSGSIVEEQLCGFHYIDPPKQRSNKRGSYMIVYHESSGHISHLPVSQIGKTVFFTYEDAKIALDARRGVCVENSKEGADG